MKPIIHVAILWREILPVVVDYFFWWQVSRFCYVFVTCACSSWSNSITYEEIPVVSGRKDGGRQSSWSRCHPLLGKGRYTINLSYVLHVYDSSILRILKFVWQINFILGVSDVCRSRWLSTKYSLRVYCVYSDLYQRGVEPPPPKLSHFLGIFLRDLNPNVALRLKCSYIFKGAWCTNLA